MPTIAIITCEILELEFARLLSNDSDIGEVIVIENNYSGRFIEAMEKSGSKNLVRIPHLNNFRNNPGERLNVIVLFLGMKLHRSRIILAKSIVKAVQEMSHFAESLFIGYGLCGTGSVNVLEYVKKDIPVHFLSDGGQPVDDCVGLLIGGRKIYYEEQCKTPGTFYITPGWSIHWRQMFGSASARQYEGSIKKMFTGYSRMLLIGNPVMTEESMLENIAGLNNLLCLNIETRKGTVKLLEDSWEMVTQSVCT